MNKIFILFFVVCIFIGGCNYQKNEDSIVFVLLNTSLLYDSVGNPYLRIKQYAEYKFYNKDSLFIGVSGNYDYYENNFRIDNEKPFHFGLEKFYANKIDRDFTELMTKILNEEYDESYVINRNGKQKIIFNFYESQLHEDLKKVDSLIKRQINLSTQMIDKPNYSQQAILDLQDSLFRRLPPPPPPLNSTVKFTNN